MHTFNFVKYLFNHPNRKYIGPEAQRVPRLRRISCMHPKIVFTMNQVKKKVDAILLGWVT